MTPKSTSKTATMLLGLMLSAATLMTALFMAVGHYLPPEKGELGVVFPPWVSEAEAISAIIDAGGSLAGGTRFSNIIVAVAPDAQFTERVRRNGAWLTTAATGLCASVGGLEA